MLTLTMTHRNDFYELHLMEVPAILAMVMLNEPHCDASVTRYSGAMDLTFPDLERRAFWKQTFKELLEQAGEGSLRVMRLSNAYADGFVSIFTPSCQISYTASERQLARLCAVMTNFNTKIGGMKFEGETWPLMRLGQRLVDVFEEFIAKLKLDFSDVECDALPSLFGERPREERFGETYSANYDASFAAVSHLQENGLGTTCELRLAPLDQSAFYVPELLRGYDQTELRARYIFELEQIKKMYPAAMEVCVSERGNLETFCKRYQDLSGEYPETEYYLHTRQTFERYLPVLRQKLTPEQQASLQIG